MILSVCFGKICEACVKQGRLCYDISSSVCHFLKNSLKYFLLQITGKELME